MRSIKYFLYVMVLLAWFTLPVYSQSSSISIQPTKDNTLFEDANGNLSSGIGTSLYVGKTNAGKIRRGIVAFDVAGSVPSGAIVDSAVFTMKMTKTANSSNQPTQLHKVLADWGEGNSNSGDGKGAISQSNDATWKHAFFNTTNWENLGGDFAVSVSSQTDVGGNGTYSWIGGNGTQMLQDVQSWLDTPAENYGWIITGNESSNKNTKQFTSREGETGPVLEVFYTVVTDITEDLSQPANFELLGNYPNPFNPTTTIKYSLAKSSDVELTIYNSSGQRVAGYINANESAGSHNFVFNAVNLSSGIYFYQLRGNGLSQTKKMVLMK